VKGLAWLGIPTGDCPAAVRFSGETLGLEVACDAGNTGELAAGTGDRIQLSGPGHRHFESCRSDGASIVPLLEVDDLDQASAGLPGEPESDGTWTWLTFRAPGGNIPSLGAHMASLPGNKAPLRPNSLEMRHVRTFREALHRSCRAPIRVLAGCRSKMRTLLPVRPGPGR